MREIKLYLPSLYYVIHQTDFSVSFFGSMSINNKKYEPDNIFYISWVHFLTRKT